jgi:hypothetical protein
VVYFKLSIAFISMAALFVVDGLMGLWVDGFMGCIAVWWPLKGS